MTLNIIFKGTEYESVMVFFNREDSLKTVYRQLRGNDLYGQVSDNRARVLVNTIVKALKKIFGSVYRVAL